MTSSTARMTALIVTVTLALSHAAFAQDTMVKGEVKKIDLAAGKITLKHGPIRSLDMDDETMTMVFRVQDPALLKQVKTGDRIQFEAGRTAAGITVTKMQKAK